MNSERFNLRSISKNYLLLSAIILSFACCRKNTHTSAETSVVNKAAPQNNLTVLKSPLSGSEYKLGETVKIELEFDTALAVIDSVRITGLNEQITFRENYGTMLWSTTKARAGMNNIRIAVHFADGTSESHNSGFLLAPEKPPVNYTYSIINKFPHDDEAYTQGLFFHDGRLYESTGLEGSSSLRITEIATGKVIKMIPLSSEIFAEGITNVNGMIYQVTWQNRTGFVYDINTLEQIRSFGYRINEGWGLVYDGRNVIMSDGSSYLYFMEPEHFTQVDMVQVYDSQGPVDSINEMEYIDGRIYANIYGENYIVIIDPLTGTVTGKLDLDRLMPRAFRGDLAKVLNGIAWNPSTGNLYVTGKNWPELYEISVRDP